MWANVAGEAEAELDRVVDVMLVFMNKTVKLDEADKEGELLVVPGVEVDVRLDELEDIVELGLLEDDAVEEEVVVV